MTKQYETARMLLPVIVSAAASHQFLTYQTAAESIGRPRNHARAIAEVCNLLDAAAALADVPLLALVTVLDSNKQGQPECLDRRLYRARNKGRHRQAFIRAHFYQRRLQSNRFGAARDPQVREAVRTRAAGKCEFCGKLGFKCANGARYLECHHILALANDGADRMTNVIAICPGEHREVHFGERTDEMEAEMMAKVKIAEGRRLKATV